VVIVHQGTEAEAIEFFAHHGGGVFARAADPDRRLYQEFDLRQGGFRQMFGLRVWIRALEASRHGLSQGRVAGDAWQMPGCFVVHRGRILASFPYEVASDRPDYLEFVDAALSSDLTQLATLRPDGSIRPLSPVPAWPPAPVRPEGRPRLLLVGGNGSLPERFARALPLLRRHWDVRVIEVAGQGTRRDVPLPDDLEGFARDLALELDRAVLAPDGLEGVADGEAAGGPAGSPSAGFTGTVPAGFAGTVPTGFTGTVPALEGVEKVPGASFSSTSPLAPLRHGEGNPLNGDARIPSPRRGGSRAVLRRFYPRGLEAKPTYAFEPLEPKGAS
jgi:hypothetical protein